MHSSTRFLLRNYPDAYLARIGEPGTNGLPVFRSVRESGRVSRLLLLRSRFALRSVIESNPVTVGIKVPFSGGPAPYFAQSQATFRIYAEHQSSTSVNLKVYCGGDLAEPRPLGYSTPANESWLAELQGWSPSAAGIHIDRMGLLQPWYGAGPSAPPAGYGAAEGVWAIGGGYANIWVPDVDYYNPSQVLPSGETTARVWATARNVWFESAAPFHRFRGQERVFWLASAGIEWSVGVGPDDEYEPSPGESAEEIARGEAEVAALREACAAAKDALETVLASCAVRIAPVWPQAEENN